LEDKNRRLKHLVADKAVQISILKEVNSKKVVSPSQTRRAIKHVIEEGTATTAQACRALGLQRSTYYRNSSASPQSQEMARRIIDRSQEHPRYGYRRVTVGARREGSLMNAKRVRRVRSQHGLQVRKKRKLPRQAARWVLKPRDFRQSIGNKDCQRELAGGI
jgi:putative transposase